MPELYDEPGNERPDKREAALFQRYEPKGDGAEFTPW